VSFLTAEWRDLVVLNWEIPSDLLTAYVPRGTQLDTWEGRAFVSLVGFRFVKTRVMKLPVPWHVTFEEVNLRFYVKRCIGVEVRRGVAFLKEIVPRACIVLVARRLYNENYISAPMSHLFERRHGQLRVGYGWTIHGRRNSITACSDGFFREVPPDSHEEFIVEHYWGYCRQRDGGTIEYQVSHPNWRAATVDEFAVSVDFVSLYGKELGEHLFARPVSVFLASGSPVEVGFGQRF
jgi:uncharacterized protein